MPIINSKDAIQDLTSKNIQGISAIFNWLIKSFCCRIFFSILCLKKVEKLLGFIYTSRFDGGMRCSGRSVLGVRMYILLICWHWLNALQVQIHPNLGIAVLVDVRELPDFPQNAILGSFDFTISDFAAEILNSIEIYFTV